MDFALSSSNVSYRYISFLNVSRTELAGIENDVMMSKGIKNNLRENDKVVKLKDVVQLG